MGLLTLTASDCAGPDQWHWSLHEVDAAGRRNALLAEHSVSLNSGDWQYAAWLDLHSYVSIHAAPDRRREDERRITADVGAWIGEHVFGPIGPKLVERAGEEPLTVYVTVESEADKPQGQAGDEHVLFRPLELATIDGRPLSLHDVSLAFDTRPLADRTPAPLQPQPQQVRMLCVFSLPSGVGALNLRHERYQLRKQILDVTRSQGLDVELRVLQYGVTRETLKQIIREGGGWDVVHFSGHGLASKLILEHEDGSRDDVETAELVELLRPTRQRLKWVTLSACLSAAATADETLRWLGLDPARVRESTRGLSFDSADEAHDPDSSAEPDNDAESDTDDATARRMPVLARSLAEELNCGVLAMRFPVGDEFAIELAQQVYRGVLESHQPLHQALRFAMTELCGQADTARRHPALSVATPTLFGRDALDLSLHPGVSTGEPDVSDTGLAYFPPPSALLVGRVRELTRASRSLATESDCRGVLFHGMAGGGKTACAVELAWQQEDVRRFRKFVWFKAPDVGKDIATALSNFASALERQLGGNVAMLDKLDRRDELLAFLPRLKDVLRQHSVLIVIDNLESLLRTRQAEALESRLQAESAQQPPEGGTPTSTRWRDERWGDVIDALLSHDGPSRLVLTSRLVPPIGLSEFARTHGPDAFAGRLLTLPVHALSLDEAALLARQLPNLRVLLEGEQAATGFEREDHRQLVCRMLNLVQGHPKLMDLADRQAVSPAALQEQVERAQTAWAAGQQPLDAFFHDGQSELNEDDFLRVLADWTDSVSAAIPPASRELFAFLCCLEEPDRTQPIILANWDDYLGRVSRPDQAQRSSGGPTAAPADTASDADQAINAGTALRSVRPTSGETLAALQPGLAPLLAAGLVERQVADADVGRVSRPVHPPSLDTTDSATDGPGDPSYFFAIHPGVAEAGRRSAGADVQSAVDTELAAYWKQTFMHGHRTMMQGGGALVRTSGLRAAPYLLRREDWQTASTLLEQVVMQDKSSATVSTVLPLLRGIVAATAGTEDQLRPRGLLAKALLAAGRWQDAEAEQLAVADAAEQQQAWRTAGAVLGEVIYIMRATGRAAAALDVVDRLKRATARAGLGPWSRLLDDTRRLQLLNEIGRYDEVLREVARLRQHMDGLNEPGADAGRTPRPSANGDTTSDDQMGREGEAPAEPARQEPRPPATDAGDSRDNAGADSIETAQETDGGVHPTGAVEESTTAWNVRETLLNTGHTAALQTEDWPQCLELNAAIQASTQSRQASELEQARTRFNDYGPLLRLNRPADARRLLLDCRRIFDEHNDYAGVGKVLTALADLEARSGHPDRAVEAEHSALRYAYLAAEPGDCAISHFNLANYLRGCLQAGVSIPPTVRSPGVAELDHAALAHRLADACICFQTQDGTISQSLRALASELSSLDLTSPAAVLVTDDGSGFDEVVRIVEQVEGVRFGELFERLPATAASGPEALRQVLARAREQPEDETSPLERLFQAIVPPLAAAAASGEDLDPLLADIHTQLQTANPGLSTEQLDELIAQLRQSALTAAEQAGQ